MPKVNFTKVEQAFDKALQKLVIDHLSELATIADLIQAPQAHLSHTAVEEMIARFQKQLRKLKKQDPKLYERLQLSPEEEERLALSSQAYTQEDWLRLKALKLKIDELKRELYGQEELNAEYDKQVTEQRRKHVHKRFNVRDGWLPLQ